MAAASVVALLARTFAGVVGPPMIARPWCVRCMSWAEYLGVACPVHWWDLSDATRARITANVRERHPRGGRVTRVTEQMWVTARSNARSEWAAAQAALDHDAASTADQTTDPRSD